MKLVINDHRRSQAGSIAPQMRASTAVAAAVAGILYGVGGGAYAADTSADSGNQLDEIVVTATAQAVKKLDASYNIVSLSLDDIKLANPASAAEIFKLSPGVWPEASGGQTGVNIDLAGFPNGGGDSPFFTVMLQGSPLYGAPYLSFLDSSSLVRMDDSVERVEIVQGGPSAIFGPGQPGATGNFMLRTGSDKTTGSIGITYGFEGMERVDAFVSGKMTDGWYGSIGGFFLNSDGVRNPQYPSDVGGQLTGTLKHNLDNGSIMFWARTLHEKDFWTADSPYVLSGSNSVSAYGNLNQLNQTYNSKGLQIFTVPNPAGGWQTDDIGDGRGADLSYAGMNLDLKFDSGWAISDSFLFDGGQMNTKALVNNGNPMTMSTFISNLNGDGNYGNPNGFYNTNVPTAMLPYVQATYANGQPVSGNQSVLSEQVWDVQKKIMNVTDEFRLSKDFGNGNTLTGGVYLAYYTMNDNWALGPNVLMTDQPNASPIMLTATTPINIVGGDGVTGAPLNFPAGTYQISSPQGIFSANDGYYILQQGKGNNEAFYLSDSWKLNQWLLDASVRVERMSMTQETTNTSYYSLGGQYNLWDSFVSMPNGTYQHNSAEHTMPTYSVGANYEFTDHMSAYVRFNTGIEMPNFDNIRANNGGSGSAEVLALRNYEGGIKIQNHYTYIDASIYQKDFFGLGYQPTNLSGVAIGPNTTYTTHSIGVRLIGSVNPFAEAESVAVRNFKIVVNGNYENAHYQNYLGCYDYTNYQGQQVCGDLNGKQLGRLPKFQVRVAPSDTQLMNWGSLTESVTYEYIGERYQDNINATPLYAYYDLGAAIQANVGDNWQFTVLGSNLTNQFGLTEGNARFGGLTVVNNVGMGRSILGREIQIQAKYKF
jgi:outer membrane receptor protein involved in Fe transport